MHLFHEERPSDCPWVERVWYCRSEYASDFISIASSHWEIVVARFEGETKLAIRGPETRATLAQCPPETEFFGIQFRIGAFMPDLPPRLLMNRRDATLPGAADRAFWLYGAAWQYPTYDNADTFVQRLARDGRLAHDPLVTAVAHGLPLTTSARTVERRFQRATGLTRGALRQIERARYAMLLLRRGMLILDVVWAAGYYDQPHLTRALRRYAGQTPAQLLDPRRGQALSLLSESSDLSLAFGQESPPALLTG